MNFTAAEHFAENGGAGVRNQHDAQSRCGDFFGKKKHAGKRRRQNVYRAAGNKTVFADFFAAQRFDKKLFVKISYPCNFFIAEIFGRQINAEQYSEDEQAFFSGKHMDKQRNPERTDMNGFAVKLFFQTFFLNICNKRKHIGFLYQNGGRAGFVGNNQQKEKNKQRMKTLTKLVIEIFH